LGADQMDRESCLSWAGVQWLGELTPGLVDQALDLLVHDWGVVCVINGDGRLEISSEMGIITEDAWLIIQRGAGRACRVLRWYKGQN
jgi:hypothetical protein